MIMIHGFNFLLLKSWKMWHFRNALFAPFHPVFLPGLTCTSSFPLPHQLWPASMFLLKKSVPQHDASTTVPPGGLCVYYDAQCSLAHLLKNKKVRFIAHMTNLATFNRIPQLSCRSLKHLCRILSLGIIEKEMNININSYFSVFFL